MPFSDADPDPFIEVVPPSRFEDADEIFDAWLRRVGLSREHLADDDVQVDTLRALDGTSQRRYLVRRRLVEG